MISVVIPIAGAGKRFTDAGYDKPKPFIDVLGKPMIVQVMENLKLKEARYVLIARQEHLQKERKIVESIENNYNAVFIPIEKLTEGAACTVLFAHKLINNETPLLIANSDQIVDMRIHDFIEDCLKRNLDGSILTFVDPEKNPKWSFARLDDNQLVTEVREKMPISEYATVGIYLFRQGKYFVEGALDMIIRNDRVNNEFYVCPVYNFLLKDHRKIGIYNIKLEQMHGIGTPEDLKSYIKIFDSK